MAYDTNKLYNTAIEAIKEHKLFFIDDIVAYLPCTTSTFYEKFPTKSDKSEHLKELLESNRITEKVSMRKKWKDSDNATLQMGLMKLICNNEERKNLSQSYQDHTTKGKPLSTALEVTIHTPKDED